MVLSNTVFDFISIVTANVFRNAISESYQLIPAVPKKNTAIAVDL